MPNRTNAKDMKVLTLGDATNAKRLLSYASGDFSRDTPGFENQTLQWRKKLQVGFFGHMTLLDA